MDNKRRLTNKYILLAILLIAVFVLPGCRTRITNNSEVGNVQYDEDGFMSETYQERRDELGLSTAERPIMPNLGSGEADNNDDFAEGESIDYNPEEFEEDFTEPENNTNSETNNNTNNNTTTRPGTTTPTRRTTPTTRRSPTGTTTTTITITFDPGKEGTITGKKKGVKEVKSGINKNSKITPPEAKRDGYNLTYWKGSDGKKIKPGEKGTVTSTATYTAQWEQAGSNEGEKETEKKTITVTLNYNDDGRTDATTITVTEGGKYEGLSDPPARGPGYKFAGWYDGNDKQIKNGDSVNPSVTSLTAKWDYTPKDFWDNEFNEAANTIKPEDKYKCVIDGKTEGKRKLIDACKGDVTDNNAEAQLVIKFIDGLDEAKASEAADAIRAEVDEGGTDPKYPSLERIILIDTDAVESEGNQKILYKMMILEEIYGSGIWVEGNDVSKAKGKKELDTDGVKPISK